MDQWNAPGVSQKEYFIWNWYDIQWGRQIDLAFHPDIPVFIAYHLCSLISPDPIQKSQEPHEIVEIRWVKSEDIKRLISTTLNPKVANELGI